MDLLDRLLIVHTEPYSETEIHEILKIRCQEEGVDIDEMALRLLTKIGLDTSMRYAIHLIITADLVRHHFFFLIARQVSKKRKAKKIEADDVKKCYSLFVDRKRSMAHLENSQDYLFSVPKSSSASTTASTSASTSASTGDEMKD